MPKTVDTLHDLFCSVYSDLALVKYINSFGPVTLYGDLELGQQWYNGYLPDSTKALPETVLTNHH